MSRDVETTRPHVGGLRHAFGRLRIIGEDVFVSYSRADGLRYATALANELTRRGFACRIDQYDTGPGAEIPDRVKRSIRLCRMTVVVASDRAWESAHVGQEVAEFLRPPSRGQLVLIGFGGLRTTSVWYHLVEGLPINQESPETLAAGKPSESIVDLIANSFQFQRRNRRLFQVFAGLIIGIVAVVGIGSWAVARVGSQLRQVSTERDSAVTDRTAALSARDRATEERNRLGIENAKQRDDLKATTDERDRVAQDLGVQQAEVARQTRVGTALRTVGDADVQRRSRGYSLPADLLAVLESSVTLRAGGRRAEAQAALAEALLLQPRLKATIPIENGAVATGIIAGGERLVIGGQRTRVWDLSRGREVNSWPDEALSIAASADGSRFLTVNRPGQFTVRDARSLDVVGRWTCELSRESPRFALGPDGSTALATCGGEVRVFDVTTGAAKATLPQGGYVSDLRLGRPDGYVVIVNNAGDDLDYRLSLFRASDGQRVKGGRCEAPNLTYIIDPLAQRIAGGCDHAGLAGDSQLCAMDVCRTTEPRADYSLPTQARATATFSSDGRLLATSEGGLVRLWNAADGTPVSSLGLRLPTRELRFSQDGVRLAGLSDRLVWSTDVRTGNLALMIDVPENAELIGLSGNGQMVVTRHRASSTIHLWEPAVATPPASVFSGEATGASFSPDGKYLIAAGKEVRASDVEWFRVVDRASGTQLERISTDSDDEREDRVRAAATLEKYQGSGNDAVDIDALRRSLMPLESFRLVDNGRLAIVTSRNGPTLWDVKKRTAVKVSAPLPRESQPVLTRDGRYVVPRGSTVVDLRSGQVLFKTEGTVLAVSRSGFAASGEFGLVRIWNMATGEAEARLRVGDSPVAASFSPDERALAVAAGARVELWRWQLDEAVRDACSVIADNRAAANWSSLVATSGYRGACSSADVSSSPAQP